MSRMPPKAEISCGKRLSGHVTNMKFLGTESIRAIRSTVTGLKGP